LNAISSGTANTVLGYQSGFNLSTGAGNVFLGYQAGYNETGSNKLYIANSNTSSPLIYGDFSTGRVGIGVNNPAHCFETADRMRVREGSNTAGIWFYQSTPAADRAFIGMQDDNHVGFYGNAGAGWGMSMNINNGNVGIGGTPDQLLTVNGNASKVGGGSWAVYSDERLKKDVRGFEEGLDVVMKIRPVSFKYNGLGGNPDDGSEYVGIIAQELIEEAPYMFSTVSKKLNPGDNEQTDLLMYDSSALIYILVNAIQEQQKVIEDLQKEISEIRKSLGQ
jgi:hypothetical protein